MTRNIVAIIPASGVGSRMQSQLPKQYLKIQAKTILEHTLSLFIDDARISKIIIAISENDRYYSILPLSKHPKIKTVFGGETRAHSVLNSLTHLTEQDWALVHDAARPCLKRSDLDKLLQITDPNGAILATPAVDTIKRTADGCHIVHTEDRATLWHALTPQFFPAIPLKNAIQQGLAQGLAITDEASAMEFAGFHPKLVPGRSDNIKVTRPEDLALAEFYLTQGTQND
ncbi:2-C-methyl-D-erythritol 4-phosphate cytidylyltransferase [Ursidibacter maritimus]|uniref:2-C-methyl-D-erythritol 4-phosphate cytidylyltransferase n=1 Tax=Ursidibacter maritimus TaxID=1331689 RepID=A0A949WG81_9PAST|nr:2-C-methyl-D-erythritol 4-phosphate cytidylyltransferase [Ursidibacter maritimus]KAE9539182.1 2-C-methyl-D-erythritol 4-phosphate cytidylyltransferase [Ursidibacter maritimus]MBV6524754.1 2-C-methyl-D-erythritol 4-phosphate cytidylyltransferase [Ursidibacter maritimus]MBV6525492.1 2-C-methyl-D-erythritol 4-phosphate cytidylyltransferase [Ursidibacter maritimus]MBV6526962.1 2-C-methyl-D-erythritol 4-phosphate cytidylyltransferase [Ursidibacter maritimus]MBV6530026.1 2-C-methyl-D-erythritol 4